MSSTRELSKDQVFVNLYIRYKRDHEKELEWQSIRPYKQHEKLAFQIFYNYEETVSAYYYDIEYRRLERELVNERDGRKQRSIKKKLRAEAPKKERFELIKKEVRFQEACGKLPLLNPVLDWNDLQRIEENKLIDHHKYVEIRGQEVDPEELNQFIYDFMETHNVFRIKEPFVNSMLVFELMKGHWTYGYNQDEGCLVEERLKEWRRFCQRVENGKSIVHDGYYKQSKQKALVNMEKKGDTESDRYWLLKLIIDHEERYGRQISLTDNIKLKRLIKLFEGIYSESTIKKLYTNLIKSS